MLDLPWTAKPDQLTRGRVSVPIPPGAAWSVLDGNSWSEWEPDVPDVLHWWFARLDHGTVFPLHTDQHHEGCARRVWIPLDDWEPGHIFVYGDRVVTDYRRGDWIEFAPDVVHGAANLSTRVKISLQLMLTK